MTSSRAWLPPAATVLTLLLAWLAGRGPGSWSLLGGLALPLLAWFVGYAVLVRWTAALAAGLGLVLAGWPEGVAVAGYVLAGLVVGTTLRWRWRLLTVLALGALCLVPGFFLGLGGASVPVVFEAWGETLREQHTAGLPEGLSEAERVAAQADFEEALAGTLDLQRRLWPVLLALGLVIQVAVALLAGWVLASLAQQQVLELQLGSFVTWRAPFATVWCLIGGLALALAPLTGFWNSLGWNLVLAAALLLAIQGLAVLAWLVRRLLPPLGRTLFWVMGALFFAPVLCGSGALVGLADQWWDLRRSRRSPGEDADEI